MNATILSVRWRHRTRRMRGPDGNRSSGGPGADGSDYGQAAIMLLVIVAVLAVLLAAALADFGQHLIERGRAQHAADASALASLDGGRRAADDLARRNGAVIISWSRGPGPDEVTVVVRVGDSTATARATDAP
jgi:Flp pilus assembly protein TadG